MPMNTLPYKSAHSGFAHSVRGLGLIEILIAMAIGLFLSATAGVIFINGRDTYSVQENMGSLQENGRYAIDLIAGDLRRAGFWNGVYRLDNVTGTENKVVPDGSCAAGNTKWGRMIERRIYGLNDTATGYDCIGGTEHLRGDVLVVRYASPAKTAAFSANTLYLRGSPSLGRVFSGANEADGANEVTGVGAEATRTSPLTAHAYYVGSTANTCDGAAIPGLYWKTLSATGLPDSEELVVGVEHLQVEYAVDTGGDGTIDQYLDANTIETDGAYDWDQVLAAHIWVLVRSDCPESGLIDSNSYSMGDLVYTPNDRYRRQLYNSVVVLRN
jgi:type IV pilus assembly protein PilW